MTGVRRGFEIIAIAWLLIAVASCGGSDDSSDGATATTSAQGATTARESGSGGAATGGDYDFPDYFPSDFYLPEGITIEGIHQDPATGAISLTGTFEEGDIATIQADAVAGLEAAGYELLTNDDIAAFVRNGVGRVRVRTSEFLGKLTLSVDIDAWTDEQLDELRALFEEEVIVAGQASAQVGDETLQAVGECNLMGTSRGFYAEDVSITIQIDETQDPAFVYADVTMEDGRVFTLDTTAGPPYESSPEKLSVSGEAVELFNEEAGTIAFTVTATCES